jgi:hypothetical protein
MCEKYDSNPEGIKINGKLEMIGIFVSRSSANALSTIILMRVRKELIEREG